MKSGREDVLLHRAEGGQSAGVGGLKGTDVLGLVAYGAGGEEVEVVDALGLVCVCAKMESIECEHQHQTNASSVSISTRVNTKHIIKAHKEE